MTEENKPKVPLFASRPPPSAQPNGSANSRGKLRLSVSLTLLVASIIIGGVTLFWTGFYGVSENIEVRLETVSRTPADQLQLTGAAYSGMTASGLEYNIEAERVIEVKNQGGLLHLYETDGWISSDRNGITTLLANEAVYNATAAILDMSGNVRIHQQQQDVTLTSQQITALIDTGDLKTDMPVSVTGPQIDLTSEGMISQNKGEIILFTGQTQARLKQNQ